MKNPVSTYRIQLSSEFTFAHLREIVDYLDDLGIKTLYSAPFFQARSGSLHGYDVVDPLVINKGIGTLEEFRDISGTLKERGMGWLQDIVPNHMAFDGQNPWLRDICELGPKSQYYRFFDIDWDYLGWGKVMAPFLGDPLDTVLNKAELQLCFSEKGITLDYHDHSYPVSMQTYSGILAKAGSADFNQKLADTENDIGAWPELKLLICRTISADEELKSKLYSVLADINASPDKMSEELSLQYIKPTFWQRTEREINYRRFFTVNDLICLRMEDQEVFATYHAFLKSLIKEGLITGLRLDHIDGLFNPSGYLCKLREMFGEDLYIIAEKILEKGEKLPEKWPLAGTSGYEFLASVNQLLTDASKKANFDKKYAEIARELPDFKNLTYEKKKFIFQERMGGELKNLMDVLDKRNLLPDHQANIAEALVAFLAAFPVYRIYHDQFPLRKDQINYINTAYTTACHHAPQHRADLDFLKSIFLGKAAKHAPDMLYFLKRCQQFTGPLAAKGGEDTSFYIYNRLISHNEVGDSPDHFGIAIDEFHEEMQYRMQHWPQGLSATASHDTKRGEDARMRLNVLSEIPEEWFAMVERWNALAERIEPSKNVPGLNETYFIYQMLLGGLPSAQAADDEFLNRTKAYLMKAQREAKIHTNWAKPELDYENAVFQFVRDLINHPKFQESFNPFFDRVSHLGAIKSLAQVLIKITAPGTPDVYQGTELWDLSYVDPDNRRPVDFELRRAHLEHFKNISEENITHELDDLGKNFLNGKIKMYALYRALQIRKAIPGVFTAGEYVPLKISGPATGAFIAFARVLGENWIVTLAPVKVAQWYKAPDFRSDADLLGDSRMHLPEEAPNVFYELYTGKRIASEKNPLLNELLTHFPIALLSNTHSYEIK